MKNKIIHIINDLRRGGTNNCFFKLLKSSKEKEIIICLNKKGYYLEKFIDMGHQVYYLDVSSKLSLLKSILKIFEVLQKENKSYLHCWLYKSCIFGSIVSMIFGNKKIIWNIRHSDVNFKFKNFKKHLTIRLCIIISNIKNINLIFNSYNSMFAHVKTGIKSNNIQVINNGFDTDLFKYLDKKEEFLKNYNIDKNSFILSMYARFHPIKNHFILFEAISIISKEFNNIHLFLAGNDISNANIKLKKILNYFNLGNKTTLAGLLDEGDLIKAYSSSDLTILTSNSESFPNVIGESMSCSTPCLSFDVGDSKRLIGKNGWVTKTNNLYELVKTLRTAITFSKKKDKWKKLKNECHWHIKKFYSKENEFLEYQKFYKKLI
tara:strand:+ start:456 stop:1586 length:1131 start_codon:yes stop_codon:yes gene_type:complete